MARVEVTFKDQVAARFSKSLYAFSDKQAKLVMVRALKRAGKPTLTRVKKTITKEAGASYRKLGGLVQSKPAPNFGNLAYTIHAEGGETNVALFGARQTKKGVTAKPWRKKRTFKSAFIVKAYGGKVMRRTGSSGKGKYMEQLYGPNIGRELVRDYTVNSWKIGQERIVSAVDHEIRFALSKMAV